MKTQHTPGPWKAGKTIGGTFGIWATDQQYNVLDDSAPGINAEANARLIAAAPDLLAALQNLWQAQYLWQAQSRPNGNLPTWFNEAAEQARAALARATNQA